MMTLKQAFTLWANAPKNTSSVLLHFRMQQQIITAFAMLNYQLSPISNLSTNLSVAAIVAQLVSLKR